MKAWICWAACQCGLASGFACLHHPSLAACQPVWQCYPTTAVLSLQNPGFQLLRECQPVWAFPLVGRTHRHTAILSLHAKFLSCFSFSLVFLPPFPPHFLSVPLPWLFSLVATHSLCLHIYPCPGSIYSPFISLLLLFQLNFRNSAVIFCCFVADKPQRVHTQTHTHELHRKSSCSVFVFICICQCTVSNRSYVWFDDTISQWAFKWLVKLHATFRLTDVSNLGGSVRYLLTYLD